MWMKWLLMGLLALGALITVGQVNEPREPTSHATAVVTVIFTGLLLWGIAVQWR